MYRTHDSKLGRDVAVKTLPAAFACDLERLARFRHEARTMAWLNHPNIAAIYGLEESDGATCLELVEGETLRGPLPPGICALRLSPDAKRLYLSISTAMQSAGAAGRTYVLPLLAGKMFPPIPAGGFHSEAEIAALSIGGVIEGADVAPGPGANVYAFSRQTVQRNLYRIPIP